MNSGEEEECGSVLDVSMCNNHGFVEDALDTPFRVL
jgi:hypothetical protein